MRILLGVYSLVASALFAIAGAVVTYVLVARPMTANARLEGIPVALILVALAYVLARFTKYMFGNMHSVAWEKAHLYVVLVFAWVSCGGSIPWGIYLVITRYREMWLVPIICTPIYTLIVWGVTAGVLQRLKAIKAGEPAD